MADHTKLRVWRRALQLAVDVHIASGSMNRGVAPGLRAQLCRAAAAIAANIAEGAGQPTAAQNARFLSIAIASTNEVENHLAFANGLGLLSNRHEQFAKEVSEIRRMLIALRRRILSP